MITQCTSPAIGDCFEICLLVEWFARVLRGNMSDAPSILGNPKAIHFRRMGSGALAESLRACGEDWFQAWTDRK